MSDPPPFEERPLHDRPFLDREALRRIETRAAHALGDDALMQRAGRAAWRAVLAHWPEALRICVVCGHGDNGGDGWALAGNAHAAGREVIVVTPGDAASRSETARRARDAYVDGGGRSAAFAGHLPEADLIVDALFGIGLSRAPEGAVASAIAAIADAHAPVLALDVPSGVDADTGDVPGVAVRATRTLQFIAPHPGLATGAALDHRGACDLATLDVPAACFDGLAPAAEPCVAAALARWLPPRGRNAHKGDSGRVLCLGGDDGHGGAIALCAEAALRAGAGLVDVATRGAHVPALLARRPEAMVRACDAADDLAPMLAAADVIAIGPGLGRGEWGRALFAAALAAGKPLVIDADGLNLLAETARPPRALSADTILTPHPGEAARLLGVGTADVQRDRHAAVRALHDRHGCVVVLKGAGTLVAAPGATVRVIAAGNPGMAVGGMGDVLTGVIAALRAQGLSAFDAASGGALLHAMAGDRAAEDGERGLLPSDLFAPLRRLANP